MWFASLRHEMVPCMRLESSMVESASAGGMLELVSVVMAVVLDMADCETVDFS